MKYLLLVILYQEVCLFGESYCIIHETFADRFLTANGKNDLFFKVKTDLSVYDTVHNSAQPLIYPVDRKGLAAENGWVTTSGTAAQIAEAVFFSMKEKGYYKYKITSSTLIDDKYWIVAAENKSDSCFLYIEIDKKDGTILRCFEN